MGQYLKKKYGISSKTLFPPSITYIRNTNKKNIKNNFKKAKVKIITVCRLSKEKNIYEIIKAISKIKKKVSLYIIGVGGEKKNITKFIKSLNLESKVKLIGF